MLILVFRRESWFFVALIIETTTKQQFINTVKWEHPGGVWVLGTSHKRAASVGGEFPRQKRLKIGPDHFYPYI
jgi:hypothetical protein